MTVEEFQERVQTFKASCGLGSEPAHHHFCYFQMDKTMVAEWADSAKLQSREHGSRNAIETIDAIYLR